MFACPFGWYQHKWLPFGAVPLGSMFQCKIDNIFSDMPNVFGIMDDILVIGYDDNRANHNAAVQKVLWWCKQVNLKLNKEKCHFRFTSILLLWGGDIRKRSSTRPTKNQSLDRHASAKQQKGTAGFPQY